MAQLTPVLTEITLPVVLLALAGYGLQRWLRFDVISLNRLLVYAAFPAFIVVTLAEAPIPLRQVRGTALFTLGQFAVLLGVGWWAAAAAGVDRHVRALVGLACAFPNSGNVGIPVIELAFGDELVVHQVVITSMHTVLILLAVPVVYTGGGAGIPGHLREALRTPMLPAVALGLALNGFDVSIPTVLRTPMLTLGKAYVGLALVSVGAQLAVSGRRVPLRAAGMAVVLRLLLAPALTGLALLVVPLPDQVRALLFVSACAPVGILVAIFAAEYRAHSELAAAVVFVSTVISPLIITGALVAARAL